MAGDPARGGPSDPDSLMPLAVLAGASAVGFWDWNILTDALTLSSGWKRQIGYEPDEIPDRVGEFEARVHPDDLSQVTARLQGCLDHPNGLYESDFRLRHKNGSYRWIVSRGEIVRNAEGQPIRMVGCHIDVTEGKDAEHAIGSSRQLYASLVRGIDGIIWEAEAHTFRFRYVSEASHDILGYAPATWIDDPTFWQDHIHADDRDRVIRFCQESTARGESHQVEYRMVAADGSLVWLRDLVTVLVDDAGVSTLLRGLMIDITAQKAVEEQLEHDRSSLQLSMDLGQLGCWELDLTTRVVTLDDQIFRMLRTTAAAQGGYQMSLGTYAERFLPQSLRARSGAEMMAALNTSDRDYTRQIEHPWIRADGTEGFVTMRFTIVKDATGRTIKGRGVVQDITERKQTELRLTRLLQGESLLSSLSQQFIEMDLEQFDTQIADALRSISEFAGVARTALFLYAKDGRRVVNSHEWCADPADSVIAELRDMPVGSFGFFREQLTALRVVSMETPADVPASSAEARWAEQRGFRSLIGYPLTSRSSVIGALVFTAAPGEIRRFDDDLRSILASFSTAMANLVSRKTGEEDRLRLERQLLQSQKMEAIGTLAGGIAHDFNNILSAIVGNLGLAMIENERGGSVEDSLLEIERASERARALVQQILAFSRQQEHERRIIALPAIVQEAIRLMRATIPAIVSIDTTIGLGVPDVFADPTQMHQILMNLCANAWHAMDDRPGQIGVDVAVRLVTPDAAARVGIEPGRYACLSVRDNGRGMDAETMARVFDPFFTTKTVGQGTGLGMSVVHGIVRSHHGGISIESAPGQGTTVHVYIPASSGAASAEQSQPQPTRGHGERILLVDDEEPIVKVMSRILERLGYSVTAFCSPVEALAAFRKRPMGFDLIISDFEMPEATGIELAKVIHGLRADLPVILCSGRYRADAGVDADSESNVRRLITKPCGAGVLSHVVREVLDERARS